MATSLCCNYIHNYIHDTLDAKVPRGPQVARDVADGGPPEGCPPGRSVIFLRSSLLRRSTGQRIGGMEWHMLEVSAIDVKPERDYNVITLERSASMKGRIVRIGNSRGIRIPKPLLEQTGLDGEVEISVNEDRIVIAPADPEDTPPRQGWAKAFAAMAGAEDDVLLDGESHLPTKWDEEEWEWE